MPRESCESYWLPRIRSALEGMGHSGLCPRCQAAEGSQTLQETSLAIERAKQESRNCGINLRTSINKPKILVLKSFWTLRMKESAHADVNALAYCCHCVTGAVFQLAGL